jgi:segregation and condensation protein B
VPHEASQVSGARLVAVGPGPLEPEDAAASPVAGAAGGDATADAGMTGGTGSGPETAIRLTAADLEALLFVAERPLARGELRVLLGIPAEEVDALLGDLEVQLVERGIRLVSSGEQVMLGTAPESGALIARYLGADAVRLSPAALETLAIVAYRQPVTRGTIERIRGVDSGHVVRSLLHRRLIREQGRADSPGRPILYATSMEFMERFGLTSLDDLPPLESGVAAQLAQAEVTVEAGAGGDPGEVPDADELRGIGASGEPADDPADG